ncbi:hypothetical protein RCH16_001896 [Cryobacterium sp. MP_M5]|uniref:hypothetical protein n=1 Tax=unclassified Cryobacterium TaxID=2649013 RepID=UPI0018C9C4CD|nr:MULTISPECIES: hypothetical protein [unclassified Cryobacterium]MBG6058462.1 hypothetical protein [Cryobacterium sp. MP_M3]MEC5176886.1 hypothetical protein [Cryobacterium sp. MP_M5]
MLELDETSELAVVDFVETGRHDFGKLNRRWSSPSRPREPAVVERAPVVEPVETP